MVATFFAVCNPVICDRCIVKDFLLLQLHYCFSFVTLNKVPLFSHTLTHMILLCRKGPVLNENYTRRKRDLFTYQEKSESDVVLKF